MNLPQIKSFNPVDKLRSMPKLIRKNYHLQYQFCHFFTKKLIPKVRYGNINDDDMRTFRSIFATKEEMIKDKEFLDARNSISYHYYSDYYPDRKTVESENIRQVFK